MQKHVLFVLTSRRTLDNPERTPTGGWLEEFAAAWYRVVDAGHKASVATPAGGETQLDPLSFQDPWITDDGRRMQGDGVVTAALQVAPALAAIDPARYDAVYFVGGAGTMWDFPDNADVARLLGAMHAAGKPVAAICHGVSCLLNQVGGQVFAKGRRLTVISDREDELAGYDKLVPYMPEGRLRAAGAEVLLAGEPFAANVVTDGLLLTGQNPASASALGRHLVEALAAG